MRAWAVSSAWRGDLRLFGRIAQKAIEEVTAFSRPAPCEIEFAVRNDCERYASVEDLLEFVPGSTLRSFNSARIRVGTRDLLVEVRFGRKRAHREAAFHCPFGVSVQVHSNGDVPVASLRQIRDAVAKVVARGGFARAKPVHGIGESEVGMKKALAHRWQRRGVLLQALLLLISGAVLLCVGVVVRVISLYAGSTGFSDFLLDPRVLSGVLGLTQPLPYLFPTFLFPAIEIADTTPGRRFIQNLGRSGVVTATVSVIVKAISG